MTVFLGMSDLFFSNVYNDRNIHGEKLHTINIPCIAETY